MFQKNKANSDEKGQHSVHLIFFTYCQSPMVKNSPMVRNNKDNSSEKGQSSVHLIFL